MIESLWGDAFVLPDKKTKEKKIIDKISKPKELKVKTEKAIASTKLSFEDKIKLVTEDVYRILGNKKDITLVIRDRESLHEYIDKCISNGVVAVDTETNNSLDPINCKIMGLCLYTPNEKQAYIPINHRDYKTKERLLDQVDENDIKEELDRLSNTDIIMHNGQFDYRVIKCQCHSQLKITWDTLIAAKLLDENEVSAGLKQQYIAKIDPTQEKYSIEHLFQKLEYADVNPELFALYAASDSFMTFKLYEWQKERMLSPDLSRVYKLFREVEMPLVEVIAELELAGMEVDFDYCQLLHNKYANKLKDVEERLDKELELLMPKIEAWRLTPEANAPIKSANGSLGKSKNEQLQFPINYSSPTQLAILFYDVLKCPVVDRKSPRSTGESALDAIADKLKLKFCDILLERRELVKLMTTYVDVIPRLGHMWADNRARTDFNQYGAATGRLSSSGNLNYQNIPSHNTDIRICFKAHDGYKIISSDYSGQEVRLTAFYAQDPAMISAYEQSKDLYAMIASMCFNTTYEECLERHPDGTIYEEGKHRRAAAKVVLLGLLYGRGAASIGKQINKSRDEAQEIIDEFFKAFPSVKNWIDRTITSAHQTGYVEDIAGRRRRLPDILLPKYDIKPLDSAKGEKRFNPFLICKDSMDTSVTNLIKKYSKKCEKIKYRKDYELLKEEARKEGIEISSNTGFIAQAERQAINSRVQGGAATLTKKALIDLYNNKRLRELGARAVNVIHDEILIEAPEKYAEEAAQILSDTMIKAAKVYVPNVPMSCDAVIESCWYLTEFFATVKKEFSDLLAGNKKKNVLPMSKEDAFEKICNIRTESTRSQLYEITREYLGDYVPKDVDVAYKSL